jgi:hypothetical protein
MVSGIWHNGALTFPKLEIADKSGSFGKTAQLTNLGFTPEAVYSPLPIAEASTASIAYLKARKKKNCMRAYCYVIRKQSIVYICIVPDYQDMILYKIACMIFVEWGILL